MSYTAGVLLLVAAMAIVTGAVLQLLQYRRGASIMTRGQLILRLTTAVVLLAVIGGIFFGATHKWPPLQELIFWTALTLLAVLVVFLALADLRILERQRHLAQAQLYRAIQEAQDVGSRKDRGAE